MAFLYILQSKVNKRYYVGSTVDLNRRLDEHNNGKTKYTRSTKPFNLVFQREFDTIREARSIEYKLKRKKSRLIIEKIIESGLISIK
ncbi:excinuclease ABC subunit C [Candidatus Roizmanbacteria bacterium CG_4_9_14_0_2_um_filter_39_13]|uniref:Excinuclease ABC subunit C n=1 Tax=Candidatus Roizmanbacteria bacterium CG_4_9_14_0_2_um_filter_39_13 TaxID=1974839 RepID=A0A2M8F0P9_9BACT|nr:MAG: excinuclease ABC subunit C [Candidatus Roizmanbacteria bacterium CG_4_9_14_0_2_um_filter_39_13]